MGILQKKIDLSKNYTLVYFTGMFEALSLLVASNIRMYSQGLLP